MLSHAADWQFVQSAAIVCGGHGPHLPARSRGCSKGLDLRCQRLGHGTLTIESLQERTIGWREEGGWATATLSAKSRLGRVYIGH